MIWTGNDHECGHPLVIDNDGDPPRCAVCTPSLSWYWETRFTHPHNMTAVA